MMGLAVRILKSQGRSFSNGGVSQFMDEGVLVNVDGPFEPDYVRTAALMLVPGNVAGHAKVVVATPTEDGGWKPASANGGVGPMMGGCYVASSDTRFHEAVEALTGAASVGAVPLHDRFETREQYRELSAD